MNVTTELREKKVWAIPIENPQLSVVKDKYSQKRVVAYCRVSTKQEEQLNSYEAQVGYYTDKINAEPNWKFVGIFADKGISGTSVKKRDEFNKMIRLCKKGAVDLILVKSISRFARNTVDCLQHTRLLKELGVDVFFEEQGIHSIDPGAEFYITIYGSIAQSESENMSANIKWGKARSAKEGKVAFSYKNFLGYRKGADGKPEIDPEQAKVVKYIYDSYLSGDSLRQIVDNLYKMKIPTPKGLDRWQHQVIISILTNEKYKGDAILNKTYVSDCLTKKVKVNKGERTKYYVENNHPAIIDSETFARVQEEIARRNGKPKVSSKAKTERGLYSGKYALTELLVCGKCKTPYRRTIWQHGEKKKAMWRCVNRMDSGKKYCSDSPAIEETVLQNAIINAIMQIAKQDINVLKNLKTHIAMGLDVADKEDKSLDIQIRIAEIDAEFKRIIDSVSNDNMENFDESKVRDLMNEKNNLQMQLVQNKDLEMKRKSTKSRLDKIFDILDGLKNHPIEYDDKMVRQLIELIVVASKDEIKIFFIGGMTVVEKLN